MMTGHHTPWLQWSPAPRDPMNEFEGRRGWSQHGPGETIPHLFRKDQDNSEQGARKVVGVVIAIH